MNIITPGYKYELASLRGKAPTQTLEFVCRPDGTAESEVDGTTNEEVLLMLIDRQRVLCQRLPSRESSIVLTKLQEALFWQNARTKDRAERGVLDTTNA